MNDDWRDMTQVRRLLRSEIRLIWSIDRREYIDQIYRLADGRLHLEVDDFDVPGWPTGEAETWRPLMEQCHDAGGWLHGVFDQQRLVAVAVLEGTFIGRERDRLQLKYLYTDQAWRGAGHAVGLFELACSEVLMRGA